MLHAAVMAHCDAGGNLTFDGVSDGILEDPRSCTFDPATLLCEGGDGPKCLTAAQVDAAKRIYAPLRDSRTGKQIFPGFSRGGELAWEGMPRGFPIAAAAFNYMVADDPDWDPMTFDVATDVRRVADADRAVARATATDPDLTEFKRLGGKLIQYHGFGEPEIASEDSINYHDSVVRQFGSPDDVDGFYRLFMVPGMGHCRGGAGATDRFDLVSAMEQWVERGVAPDRVTASRMTDGVVDRTRPLCPHPQVARWTGSGSTDDESNFECVAPTAR
jgi:feruloyl esterase